MREDQSAGSERKCNLGSVWKAPEALRKIRCTLQTLHHDRRGLPVSEDLGEGTGHVAETVGLSEPEPKRL